LVDPSRPDSAINLKGTIGQTPRQPICLARL